MTRKYRFVNGEERPVWASKRTLRALGAQEGRDAAREGREPIRWGNIEYDQAAQKAYQAEKGHTP